MEVQEFLRQVPLFADLSPLELQELAQMAKKRLFREGDIIFQRGDDGHVLYVIKDGKVKISLTNEEGQEIALSVFGPPAFFGELSLLDSAPRSADATALEKTELLALQRTDFMKTVLKYPQIALKVITVICKRLRQADEQIEDLIFRDVFGRVAKKLLELSSTYGVPTKDGIQIDLRLTQQELAALVGASRESVNKVLGFFTDKKLITTDKHKITIMRLAELHQRLNQEY